MTSTCGRMWSKVSKLYKLLRHGDPRFCHVPGKTNVGFVPWWLGSSYQAFLVAELKSLNLNVFGNDLDLRSLIFLLLGYDRSDVVHVHWPHGAYVNNYWRFPFVAFHLWLYRLAKNNVVWTVHELEFYETRFPVLDRIMVAILLRISRSLIVHSEFSARTLREQYAYRREITLLRHPTYAGCYPDDVGREAARRQLQLGHDTTVYLFLGHIKPYKGVEWLIETFKAIDDPESRLIIAGRPMDVKTGDCIRSLTVNDPRIAVHVDYIPDNRLQVFFKAADVVVFPFRKIHTSGSVLLAMSFGRAVVVPSISSLPEEVDEHSGIFFDPTRPEGLRDALLDARQKDLEDMGKRAYDRIADRTWARFGSAHALLYERLASPAGRR